MQKTTKDQTASIHSERLLEKSFTAANPMAIKNRTTYRAIWISMSRKTAIKRLPIPANTNSRCTCSGVSMVSLSTMISAYWLQKRQSHWNRMELLLDQCRRQGLKALSRLELQELGLLYRQAAADLSALREDPSGKSYARTLNLLLARAHNTIYSGQKSSARGILHFYRYTYPRVFRRNLRLITVATLLFVAGALGGMLLAITRPDYMHLFLGPRMMETIEQHKMWTDSVVSVKPLASSKIMTNNIFVTFLTFAYGITAGVGTVFMMVFNGVLIGVVGTACWLNGMS